MCMCKYIFVYLCIYIYIHHVIGLNYNEQNPKSKRHSQGIISHHCPLMRALFLGQWPLDSQENAVQFWADDKSNNVAKTIWFHECYSVVWGFAINLFRPTKADEMERTVDATTYCNDFTITVLKCHNSYFQYEVDFTTFMIFWMVCLGWFILQIHTYVCTFTKTDTSLKKTFHMSPHSLPSCARIFSDFFVLRLFRLGPQHLGDVSQPPRHRLKHPRTHGG